MADARGSTATVRIGADVGRRAAAVGRPAPPPSSAPSGTVITFRGFLAAYEEGRDAERYDEESTGRRAGTAAEVRLPSMAEGDALAGRELDR